MPNNIIKVGDKVKITNKNLQSYLDEGIIVSVENEFEYPYEIRFLSNKVYDEEELFCESDFTVTNVVELEKRMEDVKSGVEKAIDFAEDLYILISNIQKSDMKSRENALALGKVEEAIMWMERGLDKRKGDNK